MAAARAQVGVIPARQQRRGALAGRGPPPCDKNLEIVRIRAEPGGFRRMVLTEVGKECGRIFGRVAGQMHVHVF